ncbi:MAG TPA: glycosyltransferase [Gemmatimonadales bacterium]|nr:glycosyltransferase [Gemmatimonadales bacterium]
MIYRLIIRLLDTFNAMVLVYFVVLSAGYFITGLFAFRSLRRYVRRLRSLDIEDLLGSTGMPPITLIAPAFNEEATCVEATRSLLTLRYGDMEILVCNDGSKDRTMERLTEAFDLEEAFRLQTGDIPTAGIRGVYRSRVHHVLWVIDKDNGGKADTLNAGLNFCRTPLFCAMDADSLLEREALTRIVRPFVEDASTIAAGGVIRIINGCTVEEGAVTDVRLPRELLPRFQVLEYLRAFLAGRMGWHELNSTLIISGAFGVFRRELVVEVGGYATDTVGEDMELVVRLHRHCLENKIPYSIGFVPDPVAWTECPSTLKVLGRQRDRWQRGLVEVLLRHRRMLLNPRYGRIGMLAYPYFVFLEMLSPLIEVLGYVGFFVALALGRVSTLYATAFLSVAIGLGIGLSFTAVALEELGFRRYPKRSDLYRLIWLAVAENFGYRQLTALWRLRGLVTVFRKAKGWGRMERRGFGAKPA